MRLLLLRSVIRKDALGVPLRKHSRGDVGKCDFISRRLHLEGAIGSSCVWLRLWLLDCDGLVLNDQGRGQLLRHPVRIIFLVTSFLLGG